MAYQNGRTSGTLGKEREWPFCSWACPSALPVGRAGRTDDRREDCLRRSRRKRLISWRVIPVSARSAMISPITLANL